MLSFTGLSQSECTTISDGTYGNTQTTPTSPVYGLYDYGWSSTIYYQANIGSAKNISSISWYVDAFQSGYSQSGPYTFSNVKIYFAYTTLTEWSTASNVSGTHRLIGINVPQGITSWTKVYDGSITFNSSNVWKYITLDSPFSYNGTSNLIVHVENWDGSWANGYPIFHYTNAFSSSGTSVRLNKYAGQDGSMGPTSAPNRTNDKTDIQFCELVSLPIELLYFKGFPGERENVLEWESASEYNNDYYTVYYMSNDNLIWKDGVHVAGAGTSSVSHKYRSTLPYDYQGINYYMLEQTDTDGKHKTYVDLIVSIDNTSKATKIVSRITNSLGQDIDDLYKGIIFINFSDGSTIIQYRE